MNDIHVTCLDGEIIAGILKDGDDELTDLNVVTEEALRAVLDWFLQMRNGEIGVFPDRQVSYRWNKSTGGYVALVLAETFEDEKREENDV